MPYADPVQAKKYRAARYKTKRASIRRQQHAWYGTPAGRAAHLVAAAKKRARVRHLPFDLAPVDIEPILARGVCERTGIPFQRIEHGRSPYSPSIDRILPSKGYVRGNVQVILYALNAAYGFWGEQVLREIVSALPKVDG